MKFIEVIACNIKGEGKNEEDIFLLILMGKWTPSFSTGGGGHKKTIHLYNNYKFSFFLGFPPSVQDFFDN